MPSKLLPPRRVRRALLFVLALIAGLFGFVSHSTVPAGADYSSWCSDGTPGTLVQTDLLSWPIRVGVEVFAPSTSAIVCFSTAPTVAPPSPLLPSSLPLPPAGGVVGANLTIVPSTSVPSVSGGVGCGTDAGSVVTVNPCHAQAGVGIMSLGDGTYVVYIPFSVCANVCVANTPTVQRTGVVVGTLQPISGPGIGAGYRLSNFEVHIAGVQVFSSPVDLAGAFVNPGGLPGVNLPAIGGTPPCVIGGICVPTIGGVLGITGSTSTVTLVFPVVGAVTVPVTIPSTCLINFSGSC